MVIVALLLGGQLHGQSDEQPAPSFLRIARRDADVRLTWLNNNNFSGNWGIYRHTEMISAESFDQATMLAVVLAGQNSYTDRPQTAGNYFYAVIGLRDNGLPIPRFIAQQTVTVVGIPINEADLVRSRAARVSALTARGRAGAIELRFVASQPDRTLTVFRHEEPIRSLSNLREAAEAGTVESSTGLFIDRPIPGIDFYYGIFDMELIDNHLSSVMVRPGENSTETSVQLDISGLPDLPARDDIPGRRPLPLPRLSGGTTTAESLLVEELRPLPPIQPTAQVVPPPIFTPAPEREAARIQAPMILEIDRRLPGNEHERALREILLSGAFQLGQWQDAIILLSNMLAVGVPREIGERVHFYRGQALYFDGDYRSAILEFLLAGDLYAEQVRPWIDSAAFLLTT